MLTLREAWAASRIGPDNGAVLRAFGFNYQLTAPIAFTSSLPALETSEPALSFVIDSQLLTALPMSGRDVYTMLVALPGVNADGATARGLGLATNGQRPSSSSFLLDGLENNSLLLSGPLCVLPPESIGEYRVSTSNYSAEFGRTSGLVANAITPSGTNTLHGLLYAYGNHEALNANTFQRNAGYNPNYSGETMPIPRARRRETYIGGAVAGRLVREVAFLSATLEDYRARLGRDPVLFNTPSLMQIAAAFPGASGQALALLRSYQPVGMTIPNSKLAEPLSDLRKFEPQFTLDRLTALARFDQIASQTSRFFERAALTRTHEPDFISGLYDGFSSALRDGTAALAAAWYRQSSGSTNELRAGWQSESLGWNNPQPALPVVQIRNNFSPFDVASPGSPVALTFSYRSRMAEFSDTFRAH